MPAPRAVVFDLDGLMFNTEDVYWKVGQQLLARRGRRYTRELNDAVMGLTPRACFEVMIRWHALPDTCEQLAVESEQLFLSLLHEHLSPMRGLMELLAGLESARIPKAICTSSTRSVLTAVLSRFAMEPRFQFTLAAEDIVHGKPHPEIYLKAAERFAIRPQEMLALEDSEAGCRAASSSGAFVVAVPTALSAAQDFGTASLVVESLADPRLYQALGLDLPLQELRTTV